jgi:SAM-dependent methyltransferase
MNHSSTKDALRVEDWAGEMGRRWLRYLDAFESMIAPVGDALLARADFQPGQRVVDVGCGGGISSRAIAQSVAPVGTVLGVDISVELVAEANRRAERSGLANVRFVAADAGSAALPDAPFDRLHSRFGTMFFAEPPSAFRNLAHMLTVGGRADFAVWAPAKENPWVAGLMGVMQRHIELPPPEPRAPGPFALAEQEYFSELLRGSGFADIEFELWRGILWVGGVGASTSVALDFFLNAMSFGDIAKEQPADVLCKIEADLTEFFQAHESSHGVGMEGAAWLVSARRVR